MAGIAQLALTGLMVGLLLAALGWLVRFERLWPAVGGAGEYPAGTARRKDKLCGIARWLTTVDHKDIGILYAVYASITFAWAGLAAVLMRTELLTCSREISTTRSSRHTA